jgi:small subunit ribosomal protein S9
MAKAITPTFIGTGRRKTSVARVQLTPGTGKHLINRRALNEYLSVPTLRVHALAPLQTAELGDKYDVTATVEGGGLTGQAGAIRLGIARALLLVQADLKPAMRKNGFLTRDGRAKERKKYGQPGARKRFQFSKR